MIGIYKITNLINGKSYIGQSIDIQKRFNAHRSAAFNPNNKNYNFPLYKAIRKYGIENFSFEVLEECDMSELNDKEIYYISKYNTHSKFGYNQDDGGDQASHYLKLSDELVAVIIQRLKTSLDSSDDIGEDFGVTGRTIRSINSGTCYYKESETYPIRPPLYTLNENGTTKETQYYCKKCGIKIATKDSYCIECGQKSQRKTDRPEPIRLARLIKENGFCGTGRIYDVSVNTIKKWCKAYNMPHLRDDIISWYNKQIGVVNTVIKEEEKQKNVQEKKVKQINPNTNQVLNIFPSENSAARFLGKNKGNHIGEVCNGIHKLAYGFKWEYD